MLSLGFVFNNMSATHWLEMQLTGGESFFCAICITVNPFDNTRVISNGVELI